MAIWSRPGATCLGSWGSSSSCAGVAAGRVEVLELLDCGELALCKHRDRPGVAQNLALLELTGGAVVRTFDLGGASVSRATAIADSVVVEDDRHRLWFFDRRSGVVQRRLELGDPSPQMFAWAPHMGLTTDGSRAIAVVDGRVHVLEVADSLRVGPAIVAQTDHRNVWSPDGQTFACVDGYARELNLVDAATGRVRLTVAGHTGHTIGTAFSHDGSLFLTTAVDATVRLWDAHTGAPVCGLRGLPMEELRAEFSPGDRFVCVTTKGGLHLFRTSGEPWGVIEPVSAPFVHTAFSADRHWLFTLEASGLVRRWPLERSPTPNVICRDHSKGGKS